MIAAAIESVAALTSLDFPRFYEELVLNGGWMPWCVVAFLMIGVLALRYT